MSEEQCGAVRQFVDRGGNLIATGQTSLYNEWGQPRADFALSDLLAAHVAPGHRVSIDEDFDQASDTAHSYLRLTPELRADVDGPQIGVEPEVDSKRHPVLAGFDETDLLPFGGSLGGILAADGGDVLATFIPPFPIYPPETSWMRQSRTDEPGLIVHTTGKNSRIAYLPADLDRRYARDNLPDHGNLLANLVRWAAGDTLPLAVEGPGLLDCHLYRQPGRLILHLVNLTSAGAWRAPVDELIPVGPLRVHLQIPEGIRPSRLKLLVSPHAPELSIQRHLMSFQIPSVLDHEVVVLE